ncbi:MAG: hypothetical protein J0L75_13015 [Spirochaetes bacterium]|nr:hypothetical protein [Spirochaetota bacterium]
MKRYIFSLALALCLLGAPAFASFEYAATAGRGDTGVAIGGGSLSLAFNPAVLGTLFYWEVSGMYQQPYWQNLHQFAGSFAASLGGKLNLGLVGDGMVFDDAELGITRIGATAGVARGLFPGGYGGVALRVNYNGTTLDRQQTWSSVDVGADLGFLYRGFPFVKNEKLSAILAPLSLGFALRNFIVMKGDSTNQAGSGFSLEGWRAGLSYTFFNLVSLSLDSGGETLNLGAEFYISPSILRRATPGHRRNDTLQDTFLTLRAGLVRHRSSPNFSNYFSDLGSLFGDVFALNQGEAGRPSITFGAGISVFQFDINYAGILDNALALDHRFSVGYRFGYEDSYLQPSEVSLRNLFSALGKSYGRNPVGSLKLRNTSAQVLTAELGFFVKGLMDSPTTEQVVLRPRSERMVDLHAVFNESIQSFKSDKPIQGQISIRYKYQGKTIQKNLSKNFLMYDRNSITWDDPQQVMVFVTPRDPVVMEFSRKALETLGTNHASFLSPVLAKAMAVFDAVAAYGMTYVTSASGAFASDKSTRSQIDTVQYPRETLKLRAGKCGDTTVLYASLLESVGIQTAFVDIPGHVFLMFNTEVPEANATIISPDPADYVLRDGTAWVAVETTVWKDGFVAACKEGMLEYWKWVKR